MCVCFSKHYGAICHFGEERKVMSFTFQLKQLGFFVTLGVAYSEY